MGRYERGGRGGREGLEDGRKGRAGGKTGGGRNRLGGARGAGAGGGGGAARGDWGDMKRVSCDMALSSDSRESFSSPSSLNLFLLLSREPFSNMAMALGWRVQ